MCSSTQLEETIFHQSLILQPVSGIYSMWTFRAQPSTAIRRSDHFLILIHAMGRLNPKKKSKPQNKRKFYRYMYTHTHARTHLLFCRQIYLIRFCCRTTDITEVSRTNFWRNHFVFPWWFLTACMEGFQSVWLLGCERFNIEDYLVSY